MAKLRDNSIDLETFCKNYNREDLLREWDYKKNGDLTPKLVAHGSDVKAWWKCSEGHSYLSRIANRTALHRGCPYCSGRKSIEGVSDFKTWCISSGRDDLLEEWDYEKNSVQPSQITPHSGLKVWWKCSKGHEWESMVSSRTKSSKPTGCPYCSNPPKRILVGFNDLETWCHNNGKSDLLKEWNIERNGSLSPRNITFGSGKKVWWRCDRGHEWYVSPGNRIQGTGCPVCSRTQTSFPEQAIAYYLSKEYRLLQRYSVRGYELDVYLEDYNIGIEYDGLFYHTKDKLERELEKDAFYSSRGVTIIHIKEDDKKFGVDKNIIYYVPQKSNYLDDNFDELLRLLLSLLGNMTGKTINLDINVIRDELSIREQYASIIKNNSVAVHHPEMISEWDVEKNKGMTPDSFSANAHTKVWWRCQQGHTWKASIASRARGNGCPYCAGQRTIKGENDLESWCIQNNKQHIINEWNNEKNDMRPSDVAKNSNKIVWWKCSNGHEWKASIANRAHGTNCPFCNKKNFTSKSLTLADWCKENNREQILNEWNYDKNGKVTPETIAKGSHKKVWWKCSRGHEWNAEIKSRTYNHGCPYCSPTYKKVLTGQNDLVTWCKENNRQYILDEWDYGSNGELKPEMFTFGSHQRIVWKCEKGHTWSAVIKERTRSRGNMCPMCKKE